MNKKDLRKQAVSIKKSIDFKSVSKGICKNIKALDAYKNAKCVMLYNALWDEASLEELKPDKNKCFCFPSVKNDDIVVKLNSERTVVGKFGITEAVGAEISKDKIDLVLVPGVMFDYQFNRLGRGKGYYDRFLCDFKGIKIGICPHELLVNSVCSDDFDVKMDVIVTEKQIYKG